MADLPPLGWPSPKDVADLADKHPSYYALGAIGPDLFFFLFPEQRSACVLGKRFPIANSLIGVAEWLDDFYGKFDEWILEDWERYFGPVVENIDEALSRLTGDLPRVVSDITSKFASIGITALADLFSQNYDWWGLFSLGLNKGYDNQDFFWSDMLHYRKTSNFGISLWTHANEQNDDKLRAYALGYITHLATDTAGHPFVNEKCGGPFRTHWQRHHLVENHMDAQTYDDDYVAGRTAAWPHNPDFPAPRGGTYAWLTESALHYRLLFKDSDDDTRPRPDYKPGENSLHALYVRRRHLDIDSKMPPDLADLIFNAMGSTYVTPTPPPPAGAATSRPDIIAGNDGRPDSEAIRTAYLIMFRYLKFSMLDGFKHQKPDPPELFPNIDFPTLTDPHDDPPDEGDEDMSLGDLFLALMRFLQYLAAWAVWFATILPGIILDLATYGPRLAAYYSIQLPLYYMVKAERRIMVMTGFMHPMQDEIDIGLVRLCLGHNDAFLTMLQNMNDTLAGFEDGVVPAIIDQIRHFVEILGISYVEATTRVLSTLSITPTEPPPNSNYPHAQPLKNGDPVEYHAPWRYPSSPPELSPTFGGPYSCGDMAHVLLDGAMPGNQTIRSKYESSLTPEETDRISWAQATKTNNLGDPVNFSAYLIWQLTRNFPPEVRDQIVVPNWNLDADRGYAYKCWDWNRHNPPPPGGTNPFVLQDMEGHDYMEPCTPPPQQEVLKKQTWLGGILFPPCTKLATDEPDPNKPLLIHYVGQPDPGCVPPPVLVVSFHDQGRGTVVNVGLSVVNTGGSAAIHVNVPSVTGITAAGATFVVAPTNIPPFSVPGGGNLKPGETSGFNLFFKATSGSAAVPFSFVITMQADNVPSFSTLISVP